MKTKLLNGDMQTWWVLWTYLGKYSNVREVRALDAAAAADTATFGFSADFRRKGTVYVFDRPPVLSQGPDAVPTKLPPAPPEAK